MNIFIFEQIYRKNEGENKQGSDIPVAKIKRLLQTHVNIARNEHGTTTRIAESQKDSSSGRQPPSPRKKRVGGEGAGN